MSRPPPPGATPAAPRWRSISGPYAGDGNGHFTNDFAVGTLMGPVPGHPGSCDNAAFAANLYVAAKAHDGNSRLHAYDASAVRAFALAR